MEGPMPPEDLSRDSIPKQLLTAKESAVAQFLKPTELPARTAAFAVSSRPQQNVVGVGLGYKTTEGKPTDIRAVRIYVVRKLPKDAIPEHFLLPKAIEGIETDVIETGRFLPLPATVPLAQQRLRPAKPGCSVGFQFTGAKAGWLMAGTFGAVVQAIG